MTQVQTEIHSVKTQKQLALPEGKWIPYRFSEESSLPGLTNHLGALQVEADPVAVKHVIFPPISSAEEASGMTTLDGHLLASCGRAVDIRWSASMIERRIECNNWRLRTRTAIVPDNWAVVIELELTNLSEVVRSADLQMRLSGRCRNKGEQDYLWSVPEVSTHVMKLNRPEGLDVVERFDTQIGAVCFYNRSEPCASVQGVIGMPSKWRNRRVTLNPTVAAGESVRCCILLTYDKNLDGAQGRYQRLASRASTLIADAKLYWDEQWDQARSTVPETNLSEPLQRIYANSLVTALYLRRNYANCVGAGQLYLTICIRRGEGSYYLWDTGMAAPFLAHLDPDALRSMVEVSAAGMDIYASQAMNAFTGNGGGWFYGASPWALFRMGWAVLCVTRDFSWLDKPLKGIREGQTVLDMLEELALAWTTCAPGQAPLVTRTRAKQSCDGVQSSDISEPFRNMQTMPTISSEATYPFAVSDAGNRGSQLEANTVYEHQMASVNAGYVWMMRCVAELQESRGNMARADQLRDLANRLVSEVLRMFRPEDGFFACGKPDGTVFESRVALDHFMVMLCMPGDLPPEYCQAMVESFQRELRTPQWMRCVSESDPDVVSGYRSDTSWCGSYAGFVALMAEGLCRIGKRDLAVEWLEQVAAVTAQGPFAQSYWAEGLREPVHGGPAKSTDEFPQGTHWCEMGGVAFGSTVLHGVMGMSWSPFDKENC